jgi:hypothetical protein
VLNRVQVSTAARFVGEAPIELAGPLEMLPGVVPYPIIQNEVPVTVAGSIDGPGMEKQGPSALTIEGPLRVGVAHVRGGTLELASSTAAMRRIDLRLAGLLRLRAGGDKLLNLDDMVITDGCALDLSDNAMVIRAASDTTTGDQIRSGFAGGAWNGPGIHSSAAAADARLGIGYARADAVLDFSSGLLQSFHGVTVGPTAVLVDVALLGDANLDGSVNLRDFNKLAGNFGQSGRTWHQGDFNYDGNVNLQDFNRLAANFGLTAAGPEVTPQDWAALAVAVPEPATMAVAAPALCLMAGRARLRRGAPAVSVR